jgi:hypothetical protein
MSRKNAERILSGMGAILLAVGIIGCGSKVSGKYVAAGGMMTLVFDSGQATLTSPVTQPETDPYSVSGNTVTIHTKQQGDIELTIMQDGSLQGNGATFTKAAN